VPRSALLRRWLVIFDDQHSLREAADHIAGAGRPVV
jgi:hypothetical protein